MYTNLLHIKFKLESKMMAVSSKVIPLVHIHPTILVGYNLVNYNRSSTNC